MGRSNTILKTTKFHFESILFWPLIFLLWEPFSKKRSHWWNWSKYSKELGSGVLIKGIEVNKKRNNLWDKLLLTNFSWKDVVILRPKDYEGDYQVIYKSMYGNKPVVEECSIILNGSFACLISGDDTNFYAISYPEGEPLELEIVSYSSKWDLPEGVILI